MKIKSNAVFLIAIIIAMISYIPLFNYMQLHGMNFIPMIKEQFSSPGLIFLGYDLLVTVLIYIVVIIKVKKFNKLEKIYILAGIALSGIAFSITLAAAFALRKEEKNN
jgi:hypothetical protein